MSQTKPFLFLIGVFVMSFLVGYLVLAWTEPIGTPPDDNVLAPLNVGPVDQWKEGLLGFGGSEILGVPFELSAGELAATMIYDTDDSYYFLDPNNISVLKNTLGIGFIDPDTPDTNYKLDIKGDPAIQTDYIRDPSLQERTTKDMKADLNRDGVVNAQDVVLVADLFGCNKSAAVGCSTIPDFQDNNGNGMCDCWEWERGVDNVGNYLVMDPVTEAHPFDISSPGAVGVPDDKIDIADVAYVAKQFNDILGTPVSSGVYQEGDLNRDGYINAEDIGFIVNPPAMFCDNTLACWSDIAGFTLRGNPVFVSDCDINGDNIVDFSDSAILIANYDAYRMLWSKPAADSGDTGAIIEGSIDVYPNPTGTPDKGGHVNIKGGYLHIESITDVPLSSDCNTDFEAGRIIPRIDITNSIYRLYVCAGTAGWYYVDLTNL
jgi:hypothetical protein